MVREITKEIQMKDLIKREDAIEAIKGNSYAPGDDYMEINGYGAIKDIRALPSADRPQGEWKPKNHHTDYCSNCGFEETQWRTADYNFCPSCGARMKGADDE